MLIKSATTNGEISGSIVDRNYDTESERFNGNKNSNERFGDVRLVELLGRASGETLAPAPKAPYQGGVSRIAATLNRSHKIERDAMGWRSGRPSP